MVTIKCNNIINNIINIFEWIHKLMLYVGIINYRFINKIVIII